MVEYPGNLYTLDGIEKQEDGGRLPADTLASR